MENEFEAWIAECKALVHANSTLDQVLWAQLDKSIGTLGLSTSGQVDQGTEASLEEIMRTIKETRFNQQQVLLGRHDLTLLRFLSFLKACRVSQGEFLGSGGIICHRYLFGLVSNLPDDHGEVRRLDDGE